MRLELLLPRRTLCAVVLLVGLTAAACGDAESRSTVAASTPPVAAFPVTVSAGNGDVTLPARPERIVSLSATHTEVLYAIGAAAQVVATDLTSNYPPEVAEKAQVDAFNFDVEEVAALDPDLVVLAFDFAGEVASLEAIGVPALLLPPPARLEDAYRQIDVLGTATGRGEAAKTLVETMAAAIETAFATVEIPAGIEIYHEIDATLFSANSATFLGDIYRRFGVANIADEVPDEFGSGYVQLSAEGILAADPDVIFLGDAAFGETAESVAARPGWSSLSAVQQGAIVEVDADIAGRWGPRTVDLVEAIAGGLTDAGYGS